MGTVGLLGPVAFGVLLMLFEIAMGSLLLHKGTAIRVGLIGTMLFLLGIAPLSVLQFPWLGLLLGQAYLLTREFESSLLEAAQARLRRSFS